MKKKITIALCGNPNTGKSTVFNALTGGKQAVGNWPGKTVEKKWGPLKHKRDYRIVDLPGTYSLTAYTTEELIARNFIVEEKPDVVVDIVDASNLERNLYLTVQLLELGANVVIALNMMDIAEKRGVRINMEKLSALLGVPVVPLVANREKGIGQLEHEAKRAARRGKRKKFWTVPCMGCSARCVRGAKEFTIEYGKDIEPKVAELEAHIRKHAKKLAEKYGARWLAVKLIEKDVEIIDKIKRADTDIYDAHLERFIENASEIYGDDVEIEIADKRYGFINGILKKTVSREPVSRITRSDRIDCIVTNRFLGIPIFLVIMYLMYQLVFLVGAPFGEMIGALVETASAHAGEVLLAMDAPGWLVSLTTLGVIDGVGNVLVLVPNIALLFLAIAVLEDSGYMARAAFVMDGLMRTVGLHGKSFISVVVAFGCNVPAVMSTRILENKKDKMIAILANSLVPCSARTVLLVFLAGAFFPPEIAGQIVFAMIILSIILFMAVSKLLRKYLFSGEQTPFVMELPPYQLPTLKGLVVHTWERVRTFIYKAGSIILLLSVIIWFLASSPAGTEYGGDGSYIGEIGRLFSPVFSPLGFGWKETTALITGFVAKESVISTMGVLYGEENLRGTLAALWTPAQAFAFMIFSLLYIPCLPTVAVIKNETGSWKWTAFAIFYMLALAWVMAFLALKASALLGL